MSNLVLKVQAPPSQRNSRALSAREAEYLQVFNFLKENEGSWVLIYEQAKATTAGYLPEAAKRRMGDGYHFARRRNADGKTCDIYGLYDPTIPTKIRKTKKAGVQ